MHFENGLEPVVDLGKIKKNIFEYFVLLGIHVLPIVITFMSDWYL